MFWVFALAVIIASLYFGATWITKAILFLIMLPFIIAGGFFVFILLLLLIGGIISIILIWILRDKIDF